VLKDGELTVSESLLYPLTTSRNLAAAGEEDGGNSKLDHGESMNHWRVRKLVKTFAVTTLAVVIGGWTTRAEAQHIVDVFGGIGFNAYDTSSLLSNAGNDTAVGFTGGVGVRLWKFLGAEFELNSFNADVKGDSQTWTTYTGDILFQGRIGRVEPYGFLGAGGSHRSSENSAAGTIGGGVKIILNDHVYVRPEFRATLTNLGFFDSFARGSVALGYRW
jgi:hypothetical protein